MFFGSGQEGTENLVELHLDSQVDAKFLLGSYTCTDVPGEFRWQAGLVSEAMQKGRWLVIEEVDSLPFDILSSLQLLFEKREVILPSSGGGGGGGRVLRAHPSFRIICTRSVTATHCDSPSSPLPDSPTPLSASLDTQYEREISSLLSQFSISPQLISKYLQSTPLDYSPPTSTSYPLSLPSTFGHLLPLFQVVTLSSLPLSEISQILSALCPSLPSSVVQKLIETYQYFGGGGRAQAQIDDSEDINDQNTSQSLSSRSLFLRKIRPFTLRDLVKVGKRLQTHSSQYGFHSSLPSSSSHPSTYFSEAQRKLCLMEVADIFTSSIRDRDRPSQNPRKCPTLSSALQSMDYSDSDSSDPLLHLSDSNQSLFEKVVFQLAHIWGVSDLDLDSLIFNSKPSQPQVSSQHPTPISKSDVPSSQVLTIGRKSIPILPSSSNPNLHLSTAQLLHEQHLFSQQQIVQSHFSFSSFSLRVLEQIAGAVANNEPCLLVGETGAGKTTSVQEVANLLGQKLLVQNLSLSTDVSDLFGGFKPVTLSFLMTEPYQQFIDLFGRTFSASDNTQFLQVVSQMFRKEQWKALMKAFLKSCESAKAKLQQQLTSDLEVSVQLSSLQASWNSFSSTVQRLQSNLPKLEHGFAFSYLDGLIVEALTKGYWLLLDEINLATSETLQSLAGILEGKAIWLFEKTTNSSPDHQSGNVEGSVGSSSFSPLIRHPNFRLFAAMNPPTDVGKRELTPSLRSRFTEIYVEEVTDPQDLRDIVLKYLTSSSDSSSPTLSAPVIPVEEIVQCYLQCRQFAQNSLVDGAGQRPRYSLRSLTRTLNSTLNFLKLKLKPLSRALYEGFALNFAYLLGDPDQQIQLLEFIRKVLKVKETNKELKKAPQRPEPKSSDSILSQEIDSKNMLETFKNQHKKSKQTESRSVHSTESLEDWILVQGIWLEVGRHRAPEDWTKPNSSSSQTRFVLTKTVESYLRNLAFAIAADVAPILIQGPTSVGKTTMIEYLAARTGNKCIRINNHEHTDIQEYIGGYVTDPQTGQLVFQDGLLVQALRHGYWIILDELNLAPSDVLEALNRLFDDNKELLIVETGEVVKPMKGFHLFATQNPPGAYGGRKPLSRAFRNRFLEMCVTDLPHPEVEEIIQRACAIPEKFSHMLVTTMKELQIRRSANALFQGKYGNVTTRDLIKWGKRCPLSPLQVAREGFMLLGEKFRSEEEKQDLEELLNKICKVQIRSEMLYETVNEAELRIFLSEQPVVLHSQSHFNSEKEEDAINKFDLMHFYSFLYFFQKSQSKNELVETEVAPRTLNFSSLSGISGIAPTFGMRRMWKLLSKAMNHQEPVLFVGETGTGKTTVCQLFSAYSSQPLLVLNCHQSTETADIIGGLRPTRGRQQHFDRALKKINEGFYLFEKLHERLFGPTSPSEMGSILELIETVEELKSPLVLTQTHLELLNLLKTVFSSNSRSSSFATCQCISQSLSSASTSQLEESHLRLGIQEIKDLSSRLNSIVTLLATSSSSSSAPLDESAPVQPEDKLSKKKKRKMEKMQPAAPLPTLPQSSPSIFSLLSPFYSSLLFLANHLSDLASMSISSLSRFTSLFEWFDGPLLIAMKKGYFFLLDEINLAEDSVIERLNSVLESGREITLAEKGGGNSSENCMFVEDDSDESDDIASRPEGDFDSLVQSISLKRKQSSSTSDLSSLSTQSEKIIAHPNFRFIATMNPGGDYGKRELSPALRSRFTEIWVGKNEVDYEQFLDDSYVHMGISDRTEEENDLVMMISEMTKFNVDSHSDSLISFEFLPSPIQISRLMFKFLAWLNKETEIQTSVSKDSQKKNTGFNLSSREILAWSKFISHWKINPASPLVDIYCAVLHGAYMIIFDGMGIGGGGGSGGGELGRGGREGIEILKHKSVLKLLSLFPEDVRQEVARSAFINLFHPSSSDSPSFSFPQPTFLDGYLHFGRFSVPLGRSHPLYRSIPSSTAPSSSSSSSPYVFSSRNVVLNLTRVLRAMQIKRPILLEGPPGVGKTSLISSLAQLAGHSLVRINLSEQSELSDLLGTDLPVSENDHEDECEIDTLGTKPSRPSNKSSSVKASPKFVWQDGVFLQAMKRGDWVLLDELNLAPQSVLEGLNACLDHRESIFLPEINQLVTCPSTFRVFSAQNPMGEGGGRKGLPQSFLSRFSRVYVEAMKEEDMEEIALKMFTLDNNPKDSSSAQSESDIQHSSLDSHLTEVEVESNIHSYLSSIIPKMVTFISMLQNLVGKPTYLPLPSPISTSNADSSLLLGNLAREGGPWEFNLRDIFRWCEMIRNLMTRKTHAKSRDEGILLIDPLSESVYSLFILRLREEKDRKYIAHLFEKCFGNKLNVNFSIHENLILSSPSSFPSKFSMDFLVGFASLSSDHLPLSSSLTSLSEFSSTSSHSFSSSYTTNASMIRSVLPSPNLSNSTPSFPYFYSKILETLTFSISSNWPVLLVGSSASSFASSELLSSNHYEDLKQLVKHLARQSGRELNEFYASSSTDSADLLGSFEQKNPFRHLTEGIGKLGKGLQLLNVYLLLLSSSINLIPPSIVDDTARLTFLFIRVQTLTAKVIESDSLLLEDGRTLNELLKQCFSLVDQILPQLQSLHASKSKKNNKSKSNSGAPQSPSPSPIRVLAEMESFFTSLIFIDSKNILQFSCYFLLFWLRVDRWHHHHQPSRGKMASHPQCEPLFLLGPGSTQFTLRAERFSAFD